MATGKSYYGRSKYHFLAGDLGHHHTFSSDSTFELTEFDIYNSARSKSPEMRRSPAPTTRKPSSKRADGGDRSRGGHSSLPVNIPDWSKILKDEYRGKRSFEYDDDAEEDSDGEEGMRIPPHEFLARTRMASLSVHEGIGRTLKGRDLSRVRNAIWEKTGFED